MSKKISQLSYGLGLASSGEFVIAVAGDNYRIFHADIFAIGPGVGLGINGGGAYVGINNTDGVQCDAAAGKTHTMRQGGTLFFEHNAAGDLTLSPVSGTLIFVAANGVQIPFIDNGAGDWTTSPPADDLTWKYRVAAAVRGLLGGTIP